MTRDDFVALLDRLGDGWNRGDAAAAASVFADDVVYGDPTRYRFDRRSELLPFFEPPPGGHRVKWHRVVFDPATETGVAEYTYTGHHRYHGAALIEVGSDGLIRSWREWQHLDDERDWPAFVAGPDPGSASD